MAFHSSSPSSFVLLFYYCLEVLMEVHTSRAEMDPMLLNMTHAIQPLYCRTERGMLLPFEVYKYDTCARCYWYFPSWAFVDNVKFRYHGSRSTLTDPRNNATYFTEPQNTSHPVFHSFQSESLAMKWVACCQAAIECCLKMTTETDPVTDSPYCPQTWDGWQCWPDTPAGLPAKAICPRYVYFKSEPPSCPRFAIKTCTSNATWFTTKRNKEWTDYGGCGRVEEVRRLLYFHIATYAVSISSLVPALIIFMIYKQLQVHRISMHKNLFISLLFNGLFVMLFKITVMMDELDSSNQKQTILEQNGPGCKILFVLTKYFRMTNYMWMFCEGYYLHKLIAAAFAEQKTLVMFYIIGWAFPAIPVSIYAIIRKTMTDEQCWAIPVETYEWIMNGPNLLSLVLNLAFLFNIIRVLVTKLRATHDNEPSQYRKAVRATLVLVPLFGLHFILVIYRPQYGECGALEVYNFFSNALDGLQGFLVSLIFCYFNGEVLYLLRRSYQRYRLRNDVRGRGGGAMTLTRMSMSTQVSTVVDGNHQFHYRNGSARKENAIDSISDSIQDVAG